MPTMPEENIAATGRRFDFRDGGHDGETRAPDSPRPLTQRRPSTTAQDLPRSDATRARRPLKGLNAGETVIASGAYGLADKTHVKQIETAAAPAPGSEKE